MVDVDILRRLANELARDEHPFTVGTILEAADEIEALRKGDGYAKAIEDAARIADASWDRYSREPIDWYYGGQEASAGIARAIRALAGKDEA